MTWNCSTRSTTTWRPASPATSTCCGVGPRGSRHRVREAQLRAADVLLVDLDADPAPAESLRDLPGHVAAGERVEDGLAGLGEELHEELGQFLREAGGVDRQAGLLAAVDVGVERP